MNIEELREYCISKKGVSDSFPFDESTLVFKVMGKMFALTGINNFVSINLKCDPLYALELRADYAGIQPGYHMSKKHWNTVSINEDISDQMIYNLIDDSYDLIVKGLTKKLKVELEELD